MKDPARSCLSRKLQRLSEPPVWMLTAGPTLRIQVTTSGLLCSPEHARHAGFVTDKSELPRINIGLILAVDSALLRQVMLFRPLVADGELI